MKLLPIGGVVLAMVACLGTASAPGGGPAKAKLGTPVVLFNGKDLSGWAWHTNVAGSKIEQTWSVKDGALHSAAAPAPTGYISTEKSYKNFVLNVEYRHMTNANGGIYVCIAGEEKIWPDALQVQGKFGAVGELINQNSGMAKVTTDPARTKTVNRDVVVSRIVPPAPATMAGLEKPLKEWNTLVIRMENGTLDVTLNGILVNKASDISPAAGKIGIQAEGAEMDFRKFELTPIE